MQNMKMIILSGRISKLNIVEKAGRKSVFFDIAVSKAGKETEFFTVYGNEHFVDVFSACNAGIGTYVSNLAAEPSYREYSTGFKDSEGKEIYKGKLMCFLQSIEFAPLSNTSNSLFEKKEQKKTPENDSSFPDDYEY